MYKVEAYFCDNELNKEEEENNVFAAPLFFYFINVCASMPINIHAFLINFNYSLQIFGVGTTMIYITESERKRRGYKWAEPY